MSTSKAEKEKLQLIQEKSQQILSELLKDEDNKYCVDCDAKGPRWAAWNLGVFLCIRCAGIHRNLGVHISRVKSVNLDSWSPEQVGYMQLMGNSKARAVYEANLPDNFKRPQTDSSLEQFVRAKYEAKKYIAKEWVQPAAPKPAFDIEEERKKEKEKKRSKIVKVQTNSTIVEVQTNPVPRPHSSPAGTTIDAEKVLTNKTSSNGVKLPSTDLLGLTTTTIKSNTANDDDQFDAFVSCPINKSDNLVVIQADKVTTSIKTNEEDDFFNQKAPEQNGQKKLDKESILRLYESSNLNQSPNNLFNLTAPLQPMNINNTNSLINGSAIGATNQPGQLANNLFNITPNNNSINGFVGNNNNFNNQPPPVNNNQQSFLNFNQPAVQSIINPINNPINNLSSVNSNSTNPFLTTPSTDLFSSNVNNILSTTLESLNGLNLNSASDSTINWPNTISSNNNGNISVGNSLFSANFDNLNEKKLNGLSASIQQPATLTNPFLSNTSSMIPLQATSNQNSNLDILSAFNNNSTATNGTSTITNGLNGNDLEGWSSFHSSPNGLTADIWP